MRPPSRDLVLDACSGHVDQNHPILLAARDLALLHQARRGPAEGVHFSEIDCQRACLVHDIDCWVSAQSPPAHGGARWHTESVGAVIDRLAWFWVLAHATLEPGRPECEMHRAWTRLAELAEGYDDLIFEVSIGVRRLPDIGALNASVND